MIHALKGLYQKYQDKGFVFLDQALVSGTNFCVGIALARWLGIENYGLYSLAWMVVLFASGLQQSLFTAPLYALTAKQVDRQLWISKLSFLQLIFSILCIPIVYAIVELVFYFHAEWRIEGLPLMVSLLVAVYTLNDFFRRVLFIYRNAKSVFLMDVIGFGCQLLVLFALYQIGDLTIYNAFAGVLIVQLLSLMFYVLRFKPSISAAELKTTFGLLWNYSRYLLATSVLQWSSGNYFIIVSAAILGPATVGLIRIVQNLMGLLHVIFLALENVIPLRAADILKQGGTQALYHYLKKTFMLFLIPIMAILLMMLSFHDQIIHFLYGDVQGRVGELIMAFSMIYLMVYLGTFFRFAIRTIEFNQLIFKSYMMTTAFSLLLAQPIVSQWGLMGVVIGLGLTQIISLIYFFFALQKSFKWKIISFT